MAGAFHPFRHMDKSFRCMEFYDRKAQSASFLGVCIFYDRRELFCLRILSFRSGSCWVRAHFLGKPQKGLPEKRRTRISMGFATSKAHKRETQGKYFDLLFFSKDFFKIFRFDLKISEIIRMKIYTKIL